MIVACVSQSPVLVRPVRPHAPVSAFPEVTVPCGSVEVRDGVRPEPQPGPNVGCGKHAIVHCRTLCERRGHVIMSAHT